STGMPVDPGTAVVVVAVRASRVVVRPASNSTPTLSPQTTPPGQTLTPSDSTSPLDFDIPAQ
ncbi:MAG: hypothetical protein ACKON9_13065, partial [Planctomycetaceae bacterium]